MRTSFETYDVVGAINSINSVINKCNTNIIAHIDSITKFAESFVCKVDNSLDWQVGQNYW